MGNFLCYCRSSWRQSVVQEESATVIVSAQGRNGAFVVFCGEEGLERLVLSMVVLFAVIITLRGLAAAVVEVMAVGRGATVFTDD